MFLQKYAEAAAKNSGAKSTAAKAEGKSAPPPAASKPDALDGMISGAKDLGRSAVKGTADLLGTSHENAAGWLAGIPTALGMYLISGLWDKKGENRLSRFLTSIGVGAGAGFGAKGLLGAWRSRGKALADTQKNLKTTSESLARTQGELGKTKADFGNYKENAENTQKALTGERDAAVRNAENLQGQLSAANQDFENYRTNSEAERQAMGERLKKGRAAHAKDKKALTDAKAAQNKAWEREQRNVEYLIGQSDDLRKDLEQQKRLQADANKELGRVRSNAAKKLKSVQDRAAAAAKQWGTERSQLTKDLDTARVQRNALTKHPAVQKDIQAATERREAAIAARNKWRQGAASHNANEQLIMKRMKAAKEQLALLEGLPAAQRSKKDNAEIVNLRNHLVDLSKQQTKLRADRGDEPVVPREELLDILGIGPRY